MSGKRIARIAVQKAVCGSPFCTGFFAIGHSPSGIPIENPAPIHGKFDSFFLRSGLTMLRAGYIFVEQPGAGLFFDVGLG